MLCALTFVGVFAALAMHVGSSRAWLAVIAAAAAAGIDLLCDTLQIVVLPALAAGGPGVAPVFVAFERAAGAGGLVVANGLYTVAVLIMAVVLRERTPPAARVFAFATVLGGALLVVAGFESDARLAAIATGPTIVAFLGWTIVVARALLRSDA
jgi:hypothetical protein